MSKVLFVANLWSLLIVVGQHGCHFVLRVVRLCKSSFLLLLAFLMAHMLFLGVYQFSVANFPLC